MNYTTFDPKIDKPLHELTRADAQRAYDWFISNIESRLQELSRLVATAGIVLDYSERSVAQLHEWFVETALEERKSGRAEPSSTLFSLCNDLGIYFSEIVIRASSRVRWSMYTKDERGISYQRPVITGFATKNADYHVDFDYLLCQYAFRVLRSGRKESDLFSAMLKRALALV